MSTRLARLGFAAGFAWLMASLMTLAALITSCGKNPVGPTGASTTFQGTIVGNASVPSGAVGLSGTVNVTVQAQVASAATPGFRLPFVATLYAQATSVSASGTFHVTNDSQTTTLSGTFDSSTKALNLSGGGFTFTGAIDNGQMTGTFTGPNSATGTFSGLNSTTATVTRYCGTFTGTQSGVWNFEVANGKVLGAVVQTPKPGQSGLSIVGTLSGSTFTFTVAGITTVTGTGTIQGGSTSGTWSGGTDSGTFSGSSSAC